MPHAYAYGIAFRGPTNQRVAGRYNDNPVVCPTLYSPAG
jgi:hypothetical protein